MMMPTTKDCLTDLDSYIDSLNTYFNDSPPSLCKALIEAEIHYLNRLQMMSMDSDPIERQIRFYLNFLTRQKLESEKRSLSDTVIDAHRILYGRQAAEYGTLAGRIAARFLPTYNWMAHDEKSLRDELETLLIQTFRESVFDEILAHMATSQKMNTFRSMDPVKLKTQGAIKSINRLMVHDSIRQLDTMLVVQQFAALSDSGAHHKEMQALRHLLDKGFESSIEPLLLQSKALSTLLMVQERPATLTLNIPSEAVTKEGAYYLVRLKPSRIQRIENLVILVFDENESNGIFMKTRIAFDPNRISEKDNAIIIRLNRDAVKGYVPHESSECEMTLRGDYPTPIDSPFLDDTLKAFLEERKLSYQDCQNKLTRERDSLIYQHSVNCKVDPNGFLLQDFSKGNDVLSQVMPGKGNTKHCFMYENIRDKLNTIDEALAGTNHQYLPFTTYFYSTRPTSRDAKTFLSETLATFNEVKTLVKESGAANTLFALSSNGRGITKKRVQESIINALESPLRLKAELKPYLDSYRDLIAGKGVTAVESKLSVRQKCVSTLQQYLDKKEAECSFLNEAIAHHVLFLQQTLHEILPQRERLSASQLTCCHVLDKHIACFIDMCNDISGQSNSLIDTELEGLLLSGSKVTQQLSVMHHDTKIHRQLKQLLNVLDKISELNTARVSVSEQAAKVTVAIIGEIESNSPTWSERDVLIKMRDHLIRGYGMTKQQSERLRSKESLMMTADRTLHTVGRWAWSKYQNGFFNGDATSESSEVNPSNDKDKGTLTVPHR